MVLIYYYFSFYIKYIHRIWKDEAGEPIVSYFGPDRAQLSTTLNSINSHRFELTNDRNIALIYSVTISEQKTKDCARSGSFQQNLQYRCFQL